MSELVFLLEEASAEAMLKELLPRFLPADVVPRYIVFEGKRDLEAQMLRRMRGYRAPNAHFVVLRDQDSANCHAVKQHLVRQCKLAGQPTALVRIACRELESWYLADLAAVEKALNIPKLSANQNKAKYRNPDALVNAAEELQKLTKFRYQKIGGSRAIGPYLDLNNNRSKSFSVFVEGIKRLIHPL